jgi:hypothetical protein
MISIISHISLKICPKMIELVFRPYRFWHDIYSFYTTTKGLNTTQCIPKRLSLFTFGQKCVSIMRYRNYLLLRLIDLILQSDLPALYDLISCHQHRVSFHITSEYIAKKIPIPKHRSLPFLSLSLSHFDATLKRYILLKHEHACVEVTTTANAVKTFFFVNNYILFLQQYHQPSLMFVNNIR